VAILRELHDDLDAAVSEAYGWPANLSTEEGLARLTSLNRQRSEAEARGQVLWLRPEFQASVVRKAKTAELDLTAPKAAQQRGAWPAELTDQVLSVRRVLVAEGRPLDVADGPSERMIMHGPVKRSRLLATAGVNLVVLTQADHVEVCVGLDCSRQ